MKYNHVTFIISSLQVMMGYQRETEMISMRDHQRNSTVTTIRMHLVTTSTNLGKCTPYSPSSSRTICYWLFVCLWYTLCLPGAVTLYNNVSTIHILQDLFAIFETWSFISQWLLGSLLQTTQLLISCFVCSNSHTSHCEMRLAPGYFSLLNWLI